MAVEIISWSISTKVWKAYMGYQQQKNKGEDCAQVKCMWSPAVPFRFVD